MQDTKSMIEIIEENKNIINNLQEVNSKKDLEISQKSSEISKLKRELSYFDKVLEEKNKNLKEKNYRV